MSRWDLGRFQVQRRCEPGDRDHGRGYECRVDGWHTVDTHEDRGAAIADQTECARKQRGAYRVVDRTNGEVVSAPVDFRRAAS